MVKTTMPPNLGSDLVNMLVGTARASAEALRERVSNVRYAPVQSTVFKKCECIYFEFDGKTHVGELRGRNRDVCIDMTNPESEANKALAVRVLLDKHASLLPMLYIEKFDKGWTVVNQAGELRLHTKTGEPMYLATEKEVAAQCSANGMHRAKENNPGGWPKGTLIELSFPERSNYPRLRV